MHQKFISGLKQNPPSFEGLPHRNSVPRCGSAPGPGNPAYLKSTVEHMSRLTTINHGCRKRIWDTTSCIVQEVMRVASHGAAQCAYKILSANTRFAKHTSIEHTKTESRTCTVDQRTHRSTELKGCSVWETPEILFDVYCQRRVPSNRLTRLERSQDSLSSFCFSLISLCPHLRLCCFRAAAEGSVQPKRRKKIHHIVMHTSHLSLNTF